MQSKILLNAIEIHLESRELIVRGARTRLPWKAFDVLVLLAEAPGKVLSKEHLLRSVWGGEAVDGSNLTQAVARIRKAMGEISPGDSYIETVPRTGYRLVLGSVDASESSDAGVKISESRVPGELENVAPQSNTRGYLIALLVGALAIAVALWSLRARPKHLSGANITEVPFTAFEGDELASNFSPDGRQVAFAWAKANGPSHIYLKTLGTESIRPFATGDSNQTGPAFSPDGRSIAFLRIGATASTVVVKPVEGGAERSLTTISNPHIVLIGSPGPYLAWTRDGKGLIYANKGSICLFNIDSRHEIQLTQPPPSSVLSDADPALSPDGSTLIFSRPAAFGRADLYRLSLNQKAQPVAAPVLLYANGGWSRSPAWHPDGKHILFTSGDWVSPRLYYLDIQDPSSAEPVPNAGADALQASISPSGDTVLYTRWFFREQIFSVPLSGPGRALRSRPEPLIVSSRADSLPRISRDGSWVTFGSDRTGVIQIWTARSDGSDLHKLTLPGSQSGSGDISPDGQQITFDGMLNGHRNIFTCDRNGNNVHRLTNDPTDEIIPRWSADGQSIYFALCHDAASDIWKKDLSTGRMKQMTTEGGSVAEESPDGRTLYFTLKDDISTPVFAMPSSGGPATKILDDVAQRAMSVTQEGIYYVSTSAQNELRFHDFKSESDKLVLSVPDLKFYFVSVSQNHKLALLGVHGPPPGDLMQIRGLSF